MASFVERMIGAAKLRSATYEEVEHDAGAMGQAITIVVMASVATAIGVRIHADAGDLVRTSLFALVSWFVWAGLTFLIGTKLLPMRGTHATWGELLRTTGFAATPGLLRIFGVVPFTTNLIFFVTSVWMLVAFVIAVQEALDFQNIWRAVAVCFVGWLVYVALGIFVY